MVTACWSKVTFLGMQSNRKGGRGGGAPERESLRERGLLLKALHLLTLLGVKQMLTALVMV